MKSRDIAQLQTAIGVQFQRSELLEQALTHSSQARELESVQPGEGRRVPDNEQLEFLGDAVLGLITTEELFLRFPQFREGELSKMRAHLVSERHLIQIARQMELGDYLKLGRGEEKSGGRSKTALLVDAFEAILGALYVDQGLDQARRFVLQHVVIPELERLHAQGELLPLSDYKSALQERAQAVGRGQPSYVLVKEQGPEHHKTFTVEARLPSGNAQMIPEFVGRAEGSTKKNAEQDAARQVLEYLETLPPISPRPARKGRG